MKGSSALCGIHPLQVPLSPALDTASSAGRAPSRTVLGRADALARAHIDAMNRKLRPIYDALDARNYKLSLKLCTAALQKTDAGLIKALKAVTLERLGRPEDALALCRAELIREIHVLPLCVKAHALPVATPLSHRRGHIIGRLQRRC